MKICYLADVNSTHTRKWVEYFKNYGHQIHIISLNSGIIDGAQVHCLGIPKSITRLNRVSDKLEYILKVKQVGRLIKEIKPDILHAHYASSYGLLGALQQFHPFILSLWGSDIYDFPKQGYIFRKILQYNMRKADIIMSTSHVMAEEAHKYTNKDILITPFGVDTRIFQPEWKEKNSNDTIIIGTVKALERIYGIDYLIQAFAKLHKKRKNLRLEIGGDGSEKDFLEGMCEDLKITEYVDFLGKLNQEEVVNAFKKFNIAVFPSLRESFGVAAVEAQACGTPLVVFDADGLKEVTDENSTSIIVRRKSPDELAQAIDKLIEDKNLRMNMGRNARNYIVENYDLENNLSIVNDIYENLSIK